jgi:hypothetical protein
MTQSNKWLCSHACEPTEPKAINIGNAEQCIAHINDVQKPATSGFIPKIDFTLDHFNGCKYSLNHSNAILLHLELTKILTKHTLFSI